MDYKEIDEKNDLEVVALLKEDNKDIQEGIKKTFHFQLPQSILLYNQNTEESISDYKEKCSAIALIINNDVTKEVLNTPEFINFTSFICQVLSKSTDADVLYYTLILISPIVTKNQETIELFDRNNISQILFKLIQSRDPIIISMCIYCISNLITQPQHLPKYEYIMHYDFLHNLVDLSPDLSPESPPSQSLNCRKSTLFLCSSVLKICPPHFIFRNALISLGIEIFKFQDDFFINFISSLRRIIKVVEESESRKEIFELLRTTPTIYDAKPFLLAISMWINPESENPVTENILKLFCCIIKYVPDSIPVIFESIQCFLDEIINSCLRFPNSNLISLSYKAFSYIIPSHSFIIEKLFREGLISPDIIFQNLDGEFGIKKSTLLLTNTLLKYGAFLPFLSFLYSEKFIDVLGSFLLSDSNLRKNGKINLHSITFLSLESLRIIAQNAEIGGRNDLLMAIHSDDILVSFDQLKEMCQNDDNICLLMDLIVKTSMPREE